MLSRPKRLSRTAFGQASTGKRAISAHFSVVVRKRPGQARGAAVVSKKVAKKSVDRHLLKRRVLAVLAPLLSEGFSVVVYARAGSPTLPFLVLSIELKALMSGALVK